MQEKDIRLEDVSDEFYAGIAKLMDDLGYSEQFVGREDEYKKLKTLIGSFIFLIHERLELKIFRRVKYSYICKWTIEFIDLACYLLKTTYPELNLNLVHKWANPTPPIIHGSLYSRSDATTKHMYH